MREKNIKSNGSCWSITGKSKNNREREREREKRKELNNCKLLTFILDLECSFTDNIFCFLFCQKKKLKAEKTKKKHRIFGKLSFGRFFSLAQSQPIAKREID